MAVGLFLFGMIIGIPIILGSIGFLYVIGYVIRLIQKVIFFIKRKTKKIKSLDLDFFLDLD